MPKTKETNEQEKERPEFLTVNFDWTEFRPDNRQYRQQSSLLKPSNVYVQIRVPFDQKYLNTDNPLNGAIIELTPLGMKFCTEELEKLFVESAPVMKEELSWDGEDDGGSEKSTPETWDDVTTSESENWEAETDTKTDTNLTWDDVIETDAEEEDIKSDATEQDFDWS